MEEITAPAPTVRTQALRPCFAIADDATLLVQFSRHPTMAGSPSIAVDVLDAEHRGLAVAYLSVGAARELYDRLGDALAAAGFDARESAA